MNKLKNTLLNITIFISYFIFIYVPYIVVIMFDIKDNFNRSICLTIVSLFYLLFLLYIYRKELKNDISKFNIKLLTKYIPIYIIGILLMGISNHIISNITNMNISTNEENVRELIKMIPIYMCFSVIIYSPFVEEVIFRKSLKNIFKNKYLFIILSGIIFGIVHMSFNDFNINEFLMIIPYMIMGFDFAYIYEKSNCIFTTMALHSIHNFILLIIQFIGG